MASEETPRPNAAAIATREPAATRGQRPGQPMLQRCHRHKGRMVRATTGRLHAVRETEVPSTEAPAAGKGIVSAEVQSDLESEDAEPPPACPYCGDERPRLVGRRRHTEIYACTREGCEQIWEHFEPAKAVREGK